MRFFYIPILLSGLLLPVLLPAQTGYYVPKALAMPVHTKENELVFSLGYGAGVEALVSYAPPIPFFVFGMGTFRFWNTHANDWLTGSPYTYKRGEQVLRTGLGWMYRNDDSFVNLVQVLAGVGYFENDGYHYYDSRPAEQSYQSATSRSVFAQINAVQIEAEMDVSVGMRFSYIGYGTLWHRYKEEAYSLKRYRVVTLDPVMAVGARFNPFRADLQVGFSMPLKSWPGEGQYSDGRTFSSSGFFYTLLGRIAISYALPLQ